MCAAAAQKACEEYQVVALGIAGGTKEGPHRFEDYTQAHLFGSGSATESAITEMARGVEGSHTSSTVDDIRRVVQNLQGQDDKRRY